MAKRRRKKFSSTLTWKTTKGFFELLFRGIGKFTPFLFFLLVGFGIFWGIREELYADPGFLVENIEIQLFPSALAPRRVSDSGARFHEKRLPSRIRNIPEFFPEQSVA